MWRVAAGNRALEQQFFFHVGGVQGLGSFLLQTAHYLGGRTGRCQQTEPAAGLKAFELAGLFDRRKVRHSQRARATGDRKSLELAALDQRHGGGQVVKHDIDLARHQTQQCRPGAGVGNMRHADTSHRLEQLAGQVDGGAAAARGHVELAGMAARILDEVWHAVDAQLSGPLGVHDHHIGYAGHQGDRYKVFLRVVGQLGIQRLVDAVCAYRTHQQGVAVAWRFGDLLGADIAGSTSPVFHHKGLSKGPGQLRRNRPGQDVGGAAWRKRHHDLHRAARPAALSQCRGRQTEPDRCKNTGVGERLKPLSPETGLHGVSPQICQQLRWLA